MTSLWLDSAPDINSDEFEPDSDYDEVVVGAGIAGLTTALMLARAGRRVAVLEARFVGAAATGNTTAKLSQLQGTRLQKIRKSMYQSVVQAYADGNRAAFDWMIDYLGERGVAADRRDAVTYAETREGVGAVQREYRVASSVGLPVRITRDAELPFPTYAALVLADQAQFDPMEVLAALVTDIRALGGRVFTGIRVNGVTASDPVRVRTTKGELRCAHLVLATGHVILDRGLYFAKVTAHRSYAMAFDGVGSLPNGMFINAETPARSIRTHHGKLITGGNGHGVGRHPSPARAIEELDTWTRQHWPEATRTHTWAAQDYIPPHHVPYVGRLPRGRGRVFLATGFEKWGMTNGVAAAMTLVADILGETTPWQRGLRSRVTTPRVLATGVSENVAVAWWYAKGYARALSRPLPDRVPPEGEALAGRRGIRPVGVSTVGGQTCSVSLVCAHLGAAVSWNDGEKSWDCPAHGSRYAADGTLLEGPARKGLNRLA